MSAKNVTVTIVADTTRLHEALGRATSAARSFGRSMRLAGRTLVRAFDTAGDRHIERILLDCIAKRQDAATTSRRLMVASDIAQILDGYR